MTVDIFRTAITKRLQVSFDYAAQSRTVLPMALGRDAAGAWQVRAQQVSGGSSSGRLDPETPKLWKLAEMSNIVLLDVIFEIPRQYRPGDKSMRHIEAEL